MKKHFKIGIITFAILTFFMCAFSTITFFIVIPYAVASLTTVFFLSFWGVKKALAEENGAEGKKVSALKWFLFVIIASLVSILAVSIFANFLGLEELGFYYKLGFFLNLANTAKVYGIPLLTLAVFGGLISLIHEFFKRKIKPLDSRNETSFLRMVLFQAFAFFIPLLITVTVLPLAFSIPENSFDPYIDGHYTEWLMLAFMNISCVFYAFYRIRNNKKVLFLSIPVYIAFSAVTFLIYSYIANILPNDLSYNPCWYNLANQPDRAILILVSHIAVYFFFVILDVILKRKRNSEFNVNSRRMYKKILYLFVFLLLSTLSVFCCVYFPPIALVAVPVSAVFVFALSFTVPIEIKRSDGNKMLLRCVHWLFMVAIIFFVSAFLTDTSLWMLKAFSTDILLFVYILYLPSLLIISALGISLSLLFFSI